MPDWHPSMGQRPGPSDTVLTYCDTCDKFIEGTLILHLLDRHPTDGEADRLAKKRERENARNATRRWRRRQLRLDLDS